MKSKAPLLIALDFLVLWAMPKVEISNIKKISKEDYELMSSDTNKVFDA